MTISDMWDLYDLFPKENDFARKLEEMIFSIENVYEEGFIKGMSVSQTINAGSCFVYFISDEESLKIGIANDVPKRLKQLQTGSSSKLNIIHVVPFNSRKEAMKKERELHKKYEAFRLEGEWFVKQPVILDELISVLN